MGQPWGAMGKPSENPVKKGNTMRKPSENPGNHEVPIRKKPRDTQGITREKVWMTTKTTTLLEQKRDIFHGVCELPCLSAGE